jgi:hypothetical protein
MYVENAPNVTGVDVFPHRGAPEMLWQTDYGQGILRVSFGAKLAYDLCPAQIDDPDVIVRPKTQRFGNGLHPNGLPSVNVALVGVNEYKDAVRELIDPVAIDSRDPVTARVTSDRIDIVATSIVTMQDTDTTQSQFMLGICRRQPGLLECYDHQKEAFTSISAHLLINRVGLEALKAYEKYARLRRPESGLLSYDPEKAIELAGNVLDGLHGALCYSSNN